MDRRDYRDPCDYRGPDDYLDQIDYPDPCGYLDQIDYPGLCDHRRGYGGHRVCPDPDKRDHLCAYVSPENYPAPGACDNRDGRCGACICSESDASAAASSAGDGYGDRSREYQNASSA